MSEQIPPNCPIPQEERRGGTGIKIPVPWSQKPIEIRGLGTIVALTFVCSAVGLYLIYEGKREHENIVKVVATVETAVTEQTYVLSLTQEERERLKITMPPSLRSKIRRGDQ